MPQIGWKGLQTAPTVWPSPQQVLRQITAPQNAGIARLSGTGDRAAGPASHRRGVPCHESAVIRIPFRAEELNILILILYCACVVACEYSVNRLTWLSAIRYRYVRGVRHRDITEVQPQTFLELP
jgi:hypothetical protein